MIVLALLAALAFAKATRTQPPARAEKSASHGGEFLEAGRSVTPFPENGRRTSETAVLRTGMLTLPSPKADLGFGWGPEMSFNAEPFVFRSPEATLAARSSIGR
jgi:hypothetical protein